MLNANVLQHGNKILTRCSSSWPRSGQPKSFFKHRVQGFTPESPEKCTTRTVLKFRHTSRARNGATNDHKMTIKYKGDPKIIKSPRAKSKLGETRRNMMTWRNHPKPLKHFEILFGLGVSNRGMNAMFIKFHHSCGVDMEAT